jgi:hypothetical protein
MSAIMNAVAFGSHAASGLMMGGGVAFGVAIPIMIFALTKIGAAMVSPAA